MSRLDDHVRMVRVKMTFAAFVRALPWTIAALAVLALLIVLVEKYTPLQLYRRAGGWFGVVDANQNDSKAVFPHLWVWVGLGVAFVLPLIYAIVRRPTSHQAAVAIDERLGLKEKFSTALYVRPSSDPFATAAVRDAEDAARGADLHNKFPIPFPGRGAMMLALALVLRQGPARISPSTTCLPRRNCRRRRSRRRVSTGQISSSAPAKPWLRSTARPRRSPTTNRSRWRRVS